VRISASFTVVEKPQIAGLGEKAAKPNEGDGETAKRAFNSGCAAYSATDACRLLR